MCGIPRKIEIDAGPKRPLIVDLSAAERNRLPASGPAKLAYFRPNWAL
jgi:hypothetical protein